MSERENPAFKNQSTNKKFSPLNTHSSPYGGLEGIGNFSSESVKNQSKENKAKFNRKKRKRIPRDQLPLTKRDQNLLEQLNTFGLLSTRQIEKHIFNNIDKSTVLKTDQDFKEKRLPSVFRWLAQRRSCLDSNEKRKLPVYIF